MRKLFAFAVFIATLIGLFKAAYTSEVDAKLFVEDASRRIFKVEDDFAKVLQQLLDTEQGNVTLESMQEIVSRITVDISNISVEAQMYDLSQFGNEDLKKGLRNLQTYANLAILGDDYGLVLQNLNSLENMATDKDIEPYDISSDNNDTEEGSGSVYLAYSPDVLQILAKSENPDELYYYWNEWRQKNEQWALGNFHDFINKILEAADILGISAVQLWYDDPNYKDLLHEMEQSLDQLKPLYKQLHAYIREELYKKYGEDFIDRTKPIPDSILQQVIAQAAEKCITAAERPFHNVSEIPYNKFVESAHLNASNMFKVANDFYNSLGLDEIPKEFWDDRFKAILEQEGTNNTNCKNLLSSNTPRPYVFYCKRADFGSLMIAHEDMARIFHANEKQNIPAYFFSTYDIEFAVGKAVTLSASTPKHLTAIELTSDFEFKDEIFLNRLFQKAILTMFNIPISYVHNKVMHDLLSGEVDFDDMNGHYWKLMEKIAGVIPPADRSESEIDFPYNFYTDLELNLHTREFVSEILGYQFYRELCKKSGHKGEIHNCDFYGSKDAGKALKEMMQLGSSKGRHEVIRTLLPDSPTLNGDALLEFYAPLQTWLEKKNNENKAKIGWTCPGKNRPGD